MRNRLATVLLALTVFGAESLHAQFPMPMGQRRLVRIGFGGGMTVPTSNAADALENGINGQAYLLIDPGMLAPIRLNIGYQKFDFKDALLGPTGISGETTILSGVGGLTFDLLQLGPVRPYVTAGVGAFHIKDLLTNAAGDTTSSSTRFGIDGGGGIALKIGRVEAFIEGRLQNVYTEAGWIDTKTIRAIPVTFGILF